MPDLADRNNSEAAIALVLSRVFAKARKRVEDAIGNPPRFSRLDASFWQQLEQDIRDSLKPKLADIYKASAAQLLDDVETPVTRDAVEVNEGDAAAWALSRANEAASSVVRQQRKQIATAQRNYEEAIVAAGFLLGTAGVLVLAAGGKATREQQIRASRARQEAAEKVSATFSPTKAASIGVTETTKAASIGELATVARFEQQTNQEVEKLWVTEADGRVCPICRPLHRRKLSDVPPQYRDGPPAHGNCRCYLEFKAKP